ncbi:MAG TPA: alpha/beta fold hydrolase [Marmoricola sp.]|jgi:pimeloyl-ACP methyl ester carboxylesterase|nr:alpha/beta fold hydrolase [Marmoricola sp.]
MSHFVLIPGAGGASWYWHRVVPLLEEAGQTVVAVELPADDPDAGLPEYVEIGLAACAYEEDIVVVGQSLGAFTAVMLAAHLAGAHRPPRALVMLNAMIPAPGETPGEWWDAVGQVAARESAAADGGYPTEFEVDTYFLHDVDPAIFDTGPEQKPEVDVVFGSVCDIDAWPDVPTRVLVGADDRFFPVALEQRLARERAGVEAEIIPGGHLLSLSQPAALVDALLMSAS